MAVSPFSASLPFLPTAKICSNLLRSDPSIIGFPMLFPYPLIPKHRKSAIFASVAEKTFQSSPSSSSSSWIPSDESSSDDYGGWLMVEIPIKKKKKELSVFLFAATGTSIAILVALIACLSFSCKGFKYRLSAPLRALQELFMPSHSEDPAISEEKYSTGHQVSDVVDEDLTPTLEVKRERLVVPVAPDSTQQDALLVLKKLKIIEEEFKPEELCTRREYARWLVKVNSLLERSPKHRIVPSMLIAGSTVAAFDDVNIRDPDFLSVQALAEAGILPSKLSAKNSSFVDSLEDQGRVDFLPESFISRMDLVNWKAQLDYPLMSGKEEKSLKPDLFTVQMLRKKVDFMDVMDITSDASPELFMDLLSGDKSIFRKVFGNTRRLQPWKPATKAQAAVALTTGRMAGAICAELLRLEAEKTSKEVEMGEIRSEFLQKGEIQRFWEKKMKEEEVRGLEVERDLHLALHDLEKERNVLDESLPDLVKEKAALDCQQRLLSNLKEEVEEMRERLAAERADFSEQFSLRKLLLDLQSKCDALVEAKSIMEAEKEALQILRSWIEDEARKIQGSIRVLEEASRRWKWNAS